MNKQLSKGFFRTRRGALVLSFAAAVLAALVLAIYLQSVRTTTPTGAVIPDRVLVATRLIPRGTAASTIAADHLYTVASVAPSQLESGAITDPSAIDGRLAAGDIYPGQQLTQLDFTTENATTLPYQLSGAQRAIAVLVDSVHGLIGQIAAGDYVDVYVDVTGTQGSFSGTTGKTKNTGGVPTQVRLLMPDILVLSTPSAASPDMILQVNTDDIPEFAYASDYERLWFVLRPQVGASSTAPESATLNTLLGNAG